MKENLNVNKYTKADGTIDFDLLYTDGMPEKTVNAIKSIEKEGKSDGIIRDAERLRTYDNRKIKENYVLTQVEDDRINEEELLLKEMKKEQHRKDMEETKEYYKKHPIKTRDIEERQTLDSILSEEEILINEILHIAPNRRLEQYGQTHSINLLPKITRYGKTITEVSPNTRIGLYISRNKQRNFGCIQDLDIDTLPTPLFKCKGTEKIIMFEVEKQNKKGEFMISRRFISKLISFWSYMVGVRYIDNSEAQKNGLTGIRLWSKDIRFDGTEDRKMGQYFSTGEHAIGIILDILFVMRNKQYEPNKVSEQFTLIMNRYCEDLKITPEQYLQQCKGRLYKDYHMSKTIWGIPKVNPNYLFGLLDTLNSGKYLLTNGIPLIYEIYKYPIKCTDMHVKPMTEEQHKINKKEYEYDLQAYLIQNGDYVD